MGVLSAVLAVLSLMFFLDSVTVVEGAGIRRLQSGRDWRIQDIACRTAGYFGFPGDCMRFYRCVDYFGTNQRFSLFVFDCPEGTIFDDTVSVCNHPAWVSPHARCYSTAVDQESDEDFDEDFDEEDGSGQAPSSFTTTSTVRPLTTTSPLPEQISTISVSTQSPTTSEPSTTIRPTPEPTTTNPVIPELPAATISPLPEPATTVPEISEQTTSLPAITEAVTSVPVPVTSIPEVITSVPETVTSIPEAATSVPEAATSVTEPVTTIPEAVSTITEAVIGISESTESSSTESGSTESSLIESGSTEASLIESGSTETNYIPETSTDFTETTTTVPEAPASSESLSTEFSFSSTEAVPESSTDAIGSFTEVTTALPAVSAPQFLLKCGDSLFHRHPLKCELFYECVWNGLNFNINVLSCQPGLFFDERSSSCVLPEQTDECLQLPATPTVTTPSIEPQYSVASDSPYNCTAPGHFAYELDCIRFYRCFETRPGVLKGLLYRCPDGYQFSTVTDRCETQTSEFVCDRIGNRLANLRSPLQSAIVVRVADLEEFFSNANYYYNPTRQ